MNRNTVILQAKKKVIHNAAIQLMIRKREKFLKVLIQLFDVQNATFLRGNLYFYSLFNMNFITLQKYRNTLYK